MNHVKRAILQRDAHWENMMTESGSDTQIPDLWCVSAILGDRHKEVRRRCCPVWTLSE